MLKLKLILKLKQRAWPCRENLIHTSRCTSFLHSGLSSLTPNRLSLHNLSCRILLLSMLLSVFSRSFRNRIVYNQTPVTRTPLLGSEWPLSARLLCLLHRIVYLGVRIAKNKRSDIQISMQLHISFMFQMYRIGYSNIDATAHFIHVPNVTQINFNQIQVLEHLAFTMLHYWAACSNLLGVFSFRKALPGHRFRSRFLRGNETTTGPPSGSPRRKISFPRRPLYTFKFKWWNMCFFWRQRSAGWLVGLDRTPPQGAAADPAKWQDLGARPDGGRGCSRRGKIKLQNIASYQYCVYVPTASSTRCHYADDHQTFANAISFSYCWKGFTIKSNVFYCWQKHNSNL